MYYKKTVLKNSKNLHENILAGGLSLRKFCFVENSPIYEHAEKQANN